MAKKLKPDLKPKKQNMKLFQYVKSIYESKITLHSDREATVEGCRGVIDCYDDLITLKLLDGTATFIGENLHIITFSDSEVSFCGKIKSVEFSTRGDS